MSLHRAPGAAAAQIDHDVRMFNSHIAAATTTVIAATTATIVTALLTPLRTPLYNKCPSNCDT
jgi:hypothetical protein